MPNSEVSAAQAQAIRSKAEYWRSYISKLAGEQKASPDFIRLRIASLWATTFAYIEWLIKFDQYNERLTPDQISDTLHRCWGWDHELVKLFWKSGRNPVAHAGQENPFYSYYEFNGLPTNVSLNVSTWSEVVTGDWDKYHAHRAVAILPPVDMGEGDIQVVSFFHQMLRNELLPALAEQVAQKVAAETNEENLQKIVKLNRQIPH